MMNKFLFWLTGKLPCRLIKIDGKPYLERYHVCDIGRKTIYLHRFVGSDGDRNVHDHPWNALSIVLNGSYKEERLLWFDPRFGWVSKHKHVRFINWIPRHRFHRIKSCPYNTWTLFITGERLKDWGFLQIKDIHEGRQVTFYDQPSTDTGYRMRGWYKTAKAGKHCNREPISKTPIINEHPRATVITNYDDE